MKRPILFLGLSTATAAVIADKFAIDQATISLFAESPLDPFGEERQALNRSGILDDVFKGEDISWEYHFQVGWTNGSVAFPGIALDPEELRSMPAFNLTTPMPKLTPCDPDRTLVVAMTDPDAPSRDDPTNGEFCHFLAKYACRESSAFTSLLELQHIGNLKSYTPPAPPKGTGMHRYVVVAFAAEASDDDKNVAVKEKRGDDFTKPKGRKRWGYHEEGAGLARWADDNDMKPIAATYFEAMHQSPSGKTIWEDI